MKKRILEYTARIDKLLQEAKTEQDIGTDWKQVKEEHLTQISFFQHERLVHLIVTVLVALLAIMLLGIALLTELTGILLASVMLFVLFIPYIAHYYLLENEVQKMYKQYDSIISHINT